MPPGVVIGLADVCEVLAVPNIAGAFTVVFYDPYTAPPKIPEFYTVFEF